MSTKVDMRFPVDIEDVYSELSYKDQQEFIKSHVGDIERCDEDKILITPDILLKNGFSRNLQWHHCDLATGRFDVTVQLGYANKIEYVRIRERRIERRVDRVPNEYTELYITHIKYVHQLQDAFRLCGITDKTIVKKRIFSHVQISLLGARNKTSVCH